MPAKRTPRPKAPGKNIEEWQRGTERVSLRLPPDVMRRLRALAATHDPPTVAGVITSLVMGNA